MTQRNAREELHSIYRHSVKYIFIEISPFKLVLTFKVLALVEITVLHEFGYFGSSYVTQKRNLKRQSHLTASYVADGGR